MATEGVGMLRGSGISFLVSWLLGFLVSLLCGFVVFLFGFVIGFLVSWCLGFKFQRFKVPTIQTPSMLFWNDLDPILPSLHLIRDFQEYIGRIVGIVRCPSFRTEKQKVDDQPFCDF